MRTRLCEEREKTDEAKAEYESRPVGEGMAGGSHSEWLGSICHGSVALSAESIVGRSPFQISEGKMQLLFSQRAETLFNVSPGKRRDCTSCFAVCCGSDGSRQRKSMLADRVQPCCGRN